MKIKRILAATLAATMVMASSLPVFAGTTTKTGGGGSTTETVTISYAEIMEQKAVKAGAEATVGGVKVVNTIKNYNMSNVLQGAAVTLPKADVAKALGLKVGQEAKVTIFDMDAKKSPKAMASLTAGAEAIGATIVSSLDIDLSAVEKGKKVELKDGSMAMSVGLPKNVDTTKEYVMICVKYGGAIEVLEDLDTNPSTVTFAVKAGLGSYALAVK